MVLFSLSSQPTTDIRLLFLYIPLVWVDSYPSGKFYLFVSDTYHKIDIRRSFKLGASKVEITSDFVDEELSIHKAVL